MSAELCHTRMRAIEEAMFKCRPSLETIVDGDWVWRFARGYTGRANSLQSLNVEDINNAEGRLAVHVQRSRDYGIVPKFRVTPLAGPKIIDALDAQGWGFSGHTRVLHLECPDRGTRPLCVLMESKQQSNSLFKRVIYPITSAHLSVTRSIAPELENTAVVAPDSNRWREAMAGLLGLEPPSFEIYLELLAKLPPSARGFLMYQADGSLACGALGVVVDEVGAVFSLTTFPQFQRRGFGHGLMVFMQEYLRDKGAKQIVLQVEADNKPAIALYRSLGYEKAYSYIYRTLEAAK